MSPPRTGQSQVLTAVLLGGIILAAITSAFLWGLPLLEKNRDANSVATTLDDMKALSGGMETVVTEGGSREVSVNVGSGVLQIDADTDMIAYQTATKGVYVSDQNWVPLNENDMSGINRTTGEPDNDAGYGIRGVDRFGVVIGKTNTGGQDFITRYRITYRQMRDPNTQQTYVVDLVPVGQQSVSGGGQHTVSFRRGDTTVEPGNGIDGGTLHRIQVLVQVT